MVVFMLSSPPGGTPMFGRGAPAISSTAVTSVYPGGAAGLQFAP
jgi:hypothetical protein